MVRYIGMDVYREFAQLAVVEDGLVRDEGRIGVTPEALLQSPAACRRAAVVLERRGQRRGAGRVLAGLETSGYVRRRRGRRPRTRCW
jgi:hypothetical protein